MDYTVSMYIVNANVLGDNGNAGSSYGKLFISFFVNGEWVSGSQGNVFRDYGDINKGDVITQTYTLTNRPSSIRFSKDDHIKRR